MAASASPVYSLSHALAIVFVGMIATSAAPALCAAADQKPIVVPHFEETYQPYVVRIYFDSKANDGSDAYYEILKGDKPVYLQKAKVKGEKFYIGAMYPDDPDARLIKMGMNVTGGDAPDLVISEWSGYANCCLTFHIFEIGPNFKKVGTVEAMHGDVGPHFVHMDPDPKAGGLQIQLYDWTFANWNTDFADSPAPKVILRYSDGAYRVASDLMHAPEPESKQLEQLAADVVGYSAKSKSKAWPKADISPKLWGTMLDLIYSGHAQDAWKFLDMAWPPNIEGKDVFVRDFRKQLAKSPYWSEVIAMNPAQNLNNANAQTPSPSRSPEKQR